MNAVVDTSIRKSLANAVGDHVVLTTVPQEYLGDATEARALRGVADAVALPTTTEETAAVMRWCYENDVAIVPRGGGTGFSGGCVPDGGVVLSLARLGEIRSFDALLWRLEVAAGMTTAAVRTLARSSGLLFPPDPGAAEQSHIGGNVATNAGGPHAFKYGTTRAWVTGLEAVVPPGDVIRAGSGLRKDVTGYDLASLLVGSEGTHAVVTAVSLRLIPAIEESAPVVAFYPDASTGCEAIERVIGCGLVPAAIEFLDAATFALARAGFPGNSPEEPAFAVIVEADGDKAQAARLRDELRDCLSDGALVLHVPETKAETEALWRWREGVSLVVQAARGGKVSEDVGVPIERLRELLDATARIGEKHSLPGCNWGHAGDGNVHVTFMVDSTNADELARAENAAAELFEVATALGGAISGEHGVGSVKRPFVHLQLSPRERELQQLVKSVFDPKGLLNPGKKLA